MDVKDSGEFASVNQVANGNRVTPDGALDVGRLLRAILLETTDLAVAEPQAAAPVTLVAGSAVAVEVTDSQGVVYDLYVQARA